MTRFVFLAIFVFFLSACSAVSNWEQLMTLKDVGKSQAEVEKYLSKQEKLYYVLARDVQDGYLKAGLSQRDILKKYGEPVLNKRITDDPVIIEQYLYRQPKDYFSSDKIYLYFGQDKKLHSWKYHQ